MILVKQRNIYCILAKGIYGKLIELYHSTDICDELHRKLLPFLAFKREQIDETTFDCESKIAYYDKSPNDSYAYGIIDINTCLNVDDRVNIVNEILTKNEKN